MNLVPTLCVGTPGVASAAPETLSRRTASPKCVPTQSVGTRAFLSAYGETTFVVEPGRLMQPKGVVKPGGGFSSESGR
jgi:hypothetical protein